MGAKVKGSSGSSASYAPRVGEIFSGAAELFAERGYLNTTMHDIAKKINLQKGGLYYYIDSKEQILFEIINRTLDVFLKRASELRSNSGNPEKDLKNAIREFTVTLVEYHNEVELMLLATKYLRPELANIIHAKRVKYEGLFFRIISKGLELEVFERHSEKETLGILIIGSIFNYFLWNPSELHSDLDRKIEAFFSLFTKGLLVR